MNRFNGFMMGRYGMDELNRVLLYVSLAFVLIGLFINARWLTLITVLLLIVLYCRMFSRCIEKRQQENMKFLEIKSRFFGGRNSSGQRGAGQGARQGGFAKSKAKNDGKRVLICPYCKEKLRVPVGAGTIKIKCPHCGSEFEETV